MLTFLRVTGFFVNPIAWIYVAIATPLFFGFLVRAIHYWPLRSTAGGTYDDDALVGPCAGSILWPLMAVIIVGYWICTSFVWIVRALWPPPPLPRNGACHSLTCDGQCNNPDCEERQRQCRASREVECIAPSKHE